ncbi:chemotaxis response regulator protein-glutamate methylesterase [Paenibacillus larvae]|uniref:Protein-glutamate methylesterase/protein-glutamine glutaminase n=1 Tax=Paenibacillus larvae TaxID=1464 RepID=A0AAP5JXY9_9BACL|nr:chemotaxis response regulator protein-glutamate methylesterase [Paenibacillus larvae]MDT2172636.1 chemotaxis response regulator protein-glutamate methylesterase [Paenibacillus larvae]MDT2181440.1 chemotaxis response regulator protein-glutamate methylesterase [Paenibacillus larvae]MDT2194789.1 chemotaxis response regulator protein-glutamate methylesterase [Paenibacillus larvae]MDT2198128.1 chemotaxis response regulator protein-glutamate methylesterase [Paenibacillus larvae]MDT2207078.1 chemo
MAPPIQVLVVDDSLFMRKIISDLIMESSQFQVVDSAKNGKEAIEKIVQLKPDVVTLDIEMPIMNGLQALEKIMKQCPTPVVMLSSLTEEGASETIRALELGAVDFIRKPSGSISLDLYKVQKQLHEKLHIAAQSKAGIARTALQTSGAEIKKPNEPVRPGTLKRIKSVSALLGKKQMPAKPKNGGTPCVDHLVAIGTSTGGPKALQTVLQGIPAEFPAPIFIVQHMPPKFTQSLAKRLNDLCEIRVTEALDSEIAYSGHAYIAPGGMHMTVGKAENGSYRIVLNKEEPKSGHRPSVDVLFHSLLPLQAAKRHAVLMTGMGSDGARELTALRRAGAMMTIAESEETCVVYGMPRTAVEMGGAMFVLPLHEIASKLVQAVSC